jgi:hypothetical protein
MSRDSYLLYANIPSAIISDGLVTIPLWAVTSMGLSQAYSLPPIGTSGSRAIISTHDDTISLTGVLVGEERFAMKFALETLAEASKRGSAIEGLTGGAVTGLILVTALTIRTDMQIQNLSFNVNANRRQVIDISISLKHMPRPGSLGKLLDLASIGIAALGDWGSNLT